MGLDVNGVKVAGRGPAGFSAYQMAVKGGYTGSEAEFKAAMEAMPSHIEDITNPHGVTYDQTGAAALLHAAQHASDGDDPVSLSMSQISGLDEALSKKAPAGFGLNNDFKTVDNTAALDECFTCGWVRFINITTDDLLMGVRQAVIRIDSYSNSVGKEILRQTAYLFYGDIKSEIQRVCYNGTWQPWEWGNPPMLIGIEYRTTERYLGKPVYAMAKDLGNMPSQGSVSPTHGIANIDVCVRSSFVMKRDVEAGGFTLPFKTATVEVTASFAATNVTIYDSVASHTGYKCIGKLYYTKTTD